MGGVEECVHHGRHRDLSVLRLANAIESKVFASSIA
jgi:hypothetical protein